MRTTVENLYKNATYTQSELIALIAFGFIVGFLFSFNDWGTNNIRDQTVGMQNLLLYSIASIFVLFLFTYIQKAIGVFVGVHASHQVSWVYLIISVLICFFTAGTVVLFIPPVLHIAQIEHLNIGRKPFAFSIKNLRMFALLPILFLITLSVFISELTPLSSVVSSAIFWVSFFTVLYSLIPIEFLVNIPMMFAREKAEKVLSEKIVEKTETRGSSLGSILLYGSKMNLIFAFLFLMCTLISRITDGFLFVVLFSFFVALSLTTIYFVKTDLS